MLSHNGAHRGRRISWSEFEELTGRSRPAGARDISKPKRPILTTARSPAPRKRPPVAVNDNVRQPPVAPVSDSTPDRIANALFDPNVLRQSSKPRKSDYAAYKTLCRLRELARPAELSRVECRLAANDNRRACDDTGVGLDTRHEITPGNDSLDELLDAYGDGLRSRVIIDLHGRIDRFEGTIKYHQHDRRTGTGEVVEIGGLSSLGRFFGMRFHRGALEAYSRNGKKVRPAYEQGKPRGVDDAELPVPTTASAGAAPELAEMDRVDTWRDFALRAPYRTLRLLDVILNADTFLEVAVAAGLAPTSHSGRRVAKKILAEAEKLLAA